MLLCRRPHLVTAHREKEGLPRALALLSAEFTSYIPASVLSTTFFVPLDRFRLAAIRSRRNKIIVGTTSPLFIHTASVASRVQGRSCFAAMATFVRALKQTFVFDASTFAKGKRFRATHLCPIKHWAKKSTAYIGLWRALAFLHSAHSPLD